MIIKEAQDGYSSEKEAQRRSELVPESERDLPPPYAEGSKPPGGMPTSPTGSSRNSVFQPTTQQHVNYVSLYSRHNSLSGTYIVNAELPGHPLRKKSMLGHNVVPNAMFETRHSSISLNLATAGGTNVQNKTYVKVGSRHGRVNVNLFALQTNKHICLEIRTRHSDVVLFVPPNFQGALQLHSRRGNFKFLPAFAQRARVVNADDEGALVLYGEGELSSICEPTSDGLDYCALSTRHGRLIIGVSGVDHLDVESQASSIIKKVGMMMFGTEILRTMDMLSGNLKQREAGCSTPLSR